MSLPARSPVLSVWTIYTPMTIDHHGMWVVRRHDIIDGVSKPHPLASLHGDLDAARQAIPRGLYRIGRAPGDDPVIHETWI